MRIHLVGPSPPPYGGVSIHVHRLSRALLLDGHKCTVSGTGGGKHAAVSPDSPLRSAYDMLRRLPEETILHFHENHLLAGLLALHRKRVIFTTHNERIADALTARQGLRRSLARQLTRKLFIRIPRFIAVSEPAKIELVRMGCRSDRVSVCNAYLPPAADEAALPAEQSVFSEFRNRFSTLATANASALSMYKGEDLYGVDLCLQMMAKLKPVRKDFGLVIAVARGPRTANLSAFRHKAVDMGVDDRILWLEMSGPYHEIIAQCQVFLRPTSSDGFSISIAEAYEHGVPVVASDAVRRPTGCVLFRNRDSDDLTAKVEALLADYPKVRQDIHLTRIASAYPQIMAIYKALA